MFKTDSSSWNDYLPSGTVVRVVIKKSYLNPQKTWESYKIFWKDKITSRKKLRYDYIRRCLAYLNYSKM